MPRQGLDRPRFYVEEHLEDLFEEEPSGAQNGDAGVPLPTANDKALLAENAAGDDWISRKGRQRRELKSEGRLRLYRVAQPLGLQPHTAAGATNKQRQSPYDGNHAKQRRDPHVFLATAAREGGGTIEWRFRTEDARIKLKRLYLSLQE